MKEKLLISACLVGQNTKYNGGNNYKPEIEELKATLGSKAKINKIIEKHYVLS